MHGHFVIHSLEEKLSLADCYQHREALLAGSGNGSLPSSLFDFNAITRSIGRKDDLRFDIVRFRTKIVHDLETGGIEIDCALRSAAVVEFYRARQSINEIEACQTDGRNLWISRLLEKKMRC